MLLVVGCKVNAQTQSGDTALTYACENGHTDVAELLLASGAELVRSLQHLKKRYLSLAAVSISVKHIVTLCGN